MRQIGGTVMEPISRKTAAFLVAVGAVVLLAQPVWATAPTAGGGTFTDTSATTSTTRLADGNTIITSTGTGVIDGTVVGARTDMNRFVFHSDGTLNFSGVETCVCTVAGRSGTFVARFEGTGVGLAFAGHLTVISGTGGLSNLHAVVTFSGVVNPATGLGGGPYSVDYHFDA
jgi:Protein of unknown function (DUF3224)